MGDVVEPQRLEHSPVSYVAHLAWWCGWHLCVGAAQSAPLTAQRIEPWYPPRPRWWRVASHDLAEIEAYANREPWD